MSCQVGVLVVDTAIHDADDDTGLAGLYLPRLEEVDVCTGNAMGVLMTIIVIVPLGREQGVIKAVHRPGGTELSELLCRDWSDLRLRSGHSPLELYRLKALRCLD